MKQPADKSLLELQDKCADLIERIKLLRDYATTPGNTWLAKDELSKIHQITAELDTLINEIEKVN